MLRQLLITLAGIPVEGKSSVCLICINNYRIIILITGVLSLSAWVKYFYRILQTHHARTCARVRTHTPPSPPHRLSLFGGAQPTVTARSACDNAGGGQFKSTHELATRFTRGFGSFSRIKKLLGRTKTRTRDRMYCQMIRIVRDISRDDRARIATCSLRTLTDRLKENYSIDEIAFYEIYNRHKMYLMMREHVIKSHIYMDYLVLASSWVAARIKCVSFIPNFKYRVNGESKSNAHKITQTHLNSSIGYSRTLELRSPTGLAKWQYYGN